MFSKAALAGIAVIQTRQLIGSITPFKRREIDMPRPKSKLPSHASDMKGRELWNKLQQIGFSQSGFARTLRIGGSTVRSWINGPAYVPQTIAILVNLMLKTKTTPEDLGTANRNTP